MKKASAKEIGKVHPQDLKRISGQEEVQQILNDIDRETNRALDEIENFARPGRPIGGYYGRA